MTMDIAYSIAEITRPRTPFSRSMVYEEIKAGRLKARKLGRKTIILGDEYRAWLESLPLYAARQPHWQHCAEQPPNGSMHRVGSSRQPSEHAARAELAKPELTK
jgi:hypothetical protein